MRSIDRRTRFDSIEGLTVADFLSDHLPGLLDVHGDVAAEAHLALGVPPLSVDVEGERHTFGVVDGAFAVVPGSVDGAVVVELDAEQFSAWSQQQLSFNAMQSGLKLRVTGGRHSDLSAWDMIWQALLTGWRVVDPDLEMLDRHGAPLDLQQHFGPLDDPLDVAHFLREAGFLHLRGWLDPADMATIADDIDAALPHYQHGDGRSWWATTADGATRCVRLQHFFEHSPTTDALLRSETWDRVRRTLAADDDLVQPPVEGNCIEALVKPIGVVRGISDVPWHRDCNFGGHSYECSGTTVGISVTAGGPESGQLRVVAGSHRVAMPYARANDHPYLPVVPLPTEQGDITVHLSCTLHEALPPVSEERKVMYTNFKLRPPSDQLPRHKHALSELREAVPDLLAQAPTR